MLVALFSLTGCHAIDDLFCNGAGCDWTDEEWTRVKALSPLPDPPRDESNAYDFPGNEAVIALGQQFYFDPRFSGNATLVDTIGNPVPYARAAQGQPINVACATCHDPKRAGADFTSAPNTVSIGAGWYDVNGQQTLNAAQYPLLYWNGRSDSLWSQAAAVSESGVSMNGTRLNTFWVIVNNYRYDYTNVFGAFYPLPDAPTVAQFPLVGKPIADGSFPLLAENDRDTVTRVFVNWAKAIGAYERTLISRDSAFDRWVQDGPDSTWISPQAKRGVRLFVGKASCIDCHNTALFSDGKFHDIGVPQVGSHVPTVADCPSFSKTCDCTPGAEKGNCLPSGAWGGLKKLHAADTAPASGGLNYNYLRRDSTWSDNPDDDSRAAFYVDPDDVGLKGAWRTPSLRDVALTAPYMHDGYYRTLEDVLWHYNNGGAASGSGQFDKTPERAVQIKPLALTEDEVSDLVEFLKTLTGAPLATDQVVRPDASAQDASPSDGGAPDAPSDASSQ